VCLCVERGSAGRGCRGAADRGGVCVAKGSVCMRGAVGQWERGVVCVLRGSVRVRREGGRGGEERSGGWREGR